jgi:V/A-type H+/Na+-transporting ATPase subunit I
MMPFSILIGAFHVGLAIAVTGWRLRSSLRALSSVGWGAMLLGGLALGFGFTETGPEHLIELFVSAGTWLVAAGGGLVLLFSSVRPLPPRTVGDVFGRVFDGLKSLTGISQAFGDVLSYLRLFALGLASTQLALTFNDLAEQAAAHPAMGVLLGTLVFLIGHGFNFVLATLSGVVHGLRLNCIEFFRWGLSEEGHPFKPFARKA